MARLRQTVSNIRRGQHIDTLDKAGAYVTGLGPSALRQMAGQMGVRVCFAHDKLELWAGMNTAAPLFLRSVDVPPEERRDEGLVCPSCGCHANVSGAFLEESVLTAMICLLVLPLEKLP